MKDKYETCSICGQKHEELLKCNKEIVVDRGQFCYCECNDREEKLGKSTFI